MNIVFRQGLPWPPHKKRTHPSDRKWAQFKRGGKRLTLPRAIDRLTTEIGRFSKCWWRTEQVTLCCGHYAYVNAGGFKADSKCDDPGVVASFDLDGKGYTVACDTYTTCADNFAAIAAYIEGLRAQERHGVAGLDEMLAGHAALPTFAGEPWWVVLAVDQNATKSEVLDSYKKLIAQHHPDAGGSTDRAAAINAARDQALEDLAVKQ